MKNEKCVVLLSGGLDSTTTLYIAKHAGFKCYCLIFDYGQRHKREIRSAKKIAQSAKCPFEIIKISLPWKGSSLLDKKITIQKPANQQMPPSDGTPPKAVASKPANIPSTYVPGRNIIFLSFALSFAEAIKAKAIFIGANAIDFSGYPDCRPEFYRAFIKVADKGTKAGVEGKNLKIITPLIRKSKAQIINLGKKLGVPFELTWSCYRGARHPCGECDSCYFRQKGFIEAGKTDPLLN